MQFGNSVVGMKKFSILPRIILVGRLGVGKSLLGSKMQEMHNWKYIDMDTNILEGLYNPYNFVPPENYTIVSWTLLPKDLPNIVQIAIEKKYAILKMSASEEEITKNLIDGECPTEIIEDQERIEAEKFALKQLDIVCNVTTILNTEYSVQNVEDFVKRIHTYFLN